MEIIIKMEKNKESRRAMRVDKQHSFYMGTLCRPVSASFHYNLTRPHLSKQISAQLESTVPSRSHFPSHYPEKLTTNIFCSSMKSKAAPLGRASSAFFNRSNIFGSDNQLQDQVKSGIALKRQQACQTAIPNSIILYRPRSNPNSHPPKAGAFQFSCLDLRINKFNPSLNKKLISRDKKKYQNAKILMSQTCTSAFQKTHQSSHITSDTSNLLDHTQNSKLSQLLQKSIKLSGRSNGIGRIGTSANRKLFYSQRKQRQSKSTSPSVEKLEVADKYLKPKIIKIMQSEDYRNQLTEELIRKSTEIYNKKYPIHKKQQRSEKQLRFGRLYRPKKGNTFNVIRETNADAVEPIQPIRQNVSSLKEAREKYNKMLEMGINGRSVAQVLKQRRNKTNFIFKQRTQRRNNMIQREASCDQLDFQPW